MSDSVKPQRWQPTRLPRPWDSPGKNTEMICHFLLQCMNVKSESEVTQSCPTLATPWTAAYRVPPSMEFSRQKYWSGVPLPSPVLGFSIMQTKNFQMSKLDLEKEEEPEMKLPTFVGSYRELRNSKKYLPLFHQLWQSL